MKLIIIVMIKTSGIFKNMIVTSSTRTPSFCSDKNLRDIAVKTDGIHAKGNGHEGIKEKIRDASGGLG